MRNGQTERETEGEGRNRCSWEIKSGFFILFTGILALPFYFLFTHKFSHFFRHNFFRCFPSFDKFPIPITLLQFIEIF